VVVGNKHGMAAHRRIVNCSAGHAPRDPSCSGVAGTSLEPCRHPKPVDTEDVARQHACHNVACKLAGTWLVDEIALRGDGSSCAAEI
jgi:hypothetical protein